MSALTCYQGLEERFRTLGLRSVVLGEPSGDLDLPGIYTAYDGFERSKAGQITAMHHRFVHRLLIRWQDNAAAEMELITLLHAIPAAVDADPQLGGRVPMGLASISAGDAGFVTIGGVKYRVVDYTAQVVEKAPFQSGI
jgi:hypothetical protein